MRNSDKLNRYLNQLLAETPPEGKEYSKDYRKGVIDTLEYALSKSDALPIKVSEPEEKEQKTNGNNKKEKEATAKAKPTTNNPGKAFRPVPKPNQKKKVAAA